MTISTESSFSSRMHDVPRIPVRAPSKFEHTGVVDYEGEGGFGGIVDFEGGRQIPEGEKSGFCGVEVSQVAAIDLGRSDDFEPLYSRK